MKLINLFFLLSTYLGSYAQYDWDKIAVPAKAGNGKVWKLQEQSSDDFNYTFNPTNNNANFGPPGKPAKWNNFFHNGFEGPGPTKWQRNHVAVSGGSLNIWASRRFFDNKKTKPYMKSFGWGNGEISRPETIAGCITSKSRVKFPVFVEAKLKIMNSSLASDIWLLSPDDKEEIDIIEAYGGAGSDGRNAFFAERIHLSHHVFIRPPNFKDYQPSDWNSWFRRTNVKQWGGKIVRIGVYWKSPTIIEYYIDGELERILDTNAIASRLPNGKWEYTYPAGVTSTGQNGQLVKVTSGPEKGFQKMTKADNLNAAKKASNVSVIDPFNYLQNGRKFSREMDIIINVEDQSWQAESRRSPNNSEIQNFNNNNLLVDWIRVYKPVNSSTNTPTPNTNTPPIGSIITLRKTGGDRKFVSAVTELSNDLYANKTSVEGNRQHFRVDRNNKGGISLYSMSAKKYVQTNNKNQYVILRARGNSPLNWERLQWKSKGNGKVALKSIHNGKWIQAAHNKNNAPLFPKGNADKSWETFDWAVVKGGKFLSNTNLNTTATHQIYPNPVLSGNDILVTNTKIGDTITLFDFTGKLIRTINSNDLETSIDTLNLSSGIYFIKINNAKLNKLIIE